jgi:predicted MFS family arabinose efflux permease
VIVCGIAVVIRLETEPGRRQLAVAGMCALMALFFALALIVPFLRNFYELSTPTGEAAAWALGTALGVGTMLGTLRVLRVCSENELARLEYAPPER